MGFGKVWLVGAGPGDAGLMTLRGREVLEDAEAVVYDRLVGCGVMALIPDCAEKIDVGKSGGSHPIPQKEIEAILIKLASQGKRVVRLKGGDPFLFGRGGEEMQALKDAGIPFEVVPGVTSATSVPAYAGIPVTHRGLSSVLRVITAHSKNGGLPKLDFYELARAVKNDTLVFLMGVANAGELCRELINAGIDISTPAAVIERGTTARQRCVTGSIQNFMDLVRDAKITPPAILVIGPVAEMAEKFDWRSALPLSGVSIAVTRPKERAGRLTRMLRDAGAEVISCPCIATEVLTEPLPSLSGFDWTVFTSVTGVDALFSKLNSEGRDIRELGNAKISAIGPATADALSSHGLRVDFMPSVYDGKHLALGLSERADGAVLLLRALEGSPDLTGVLAERGVNFREAALYKTGYLKIEIPDDLDMAVFTSASTVRAFSSCAAESCFVSAKAVCIGEQTALAAKDAGFASIFTASSATLPALVDAAISAARI